MILVAVWLVLLAALPFSSCAQRLPGGVLLLPALGLVGQMILSRLSRMYSQLTVNDLSVSCDPIAVRRHFHRTPENRFGDSFIIRLTEAGRVVGMLQNAEADFRLCVSKPEYAELHGEKRLWLLALFARFGISPNHVRLTDTAWDFADKMEIFCRYNLPVIIVFGRWHVPHLLPTRFQRCHAIATPTGQLFVMPCLHGFSGLPLIAENLQLLKCGHYELAGMFWGFWKYRGGSQLIFRAIMIPKHDQVFIRLLQETD